MVIGTYCPISGRYDSKAAFQEGTKTLSSTWASPLKLKIQNIISDGRQAAVEMKAVDTKCKNGILSVENLMSSQGIRLLSPKSPLGGAPIIIQ